MVQLELLIDVIQLELIGLHPVFETPDVESVFPGWEEYSPEKQEALREIYDNVKDLDQVHFEEFMYRMRRMKKSGG